MYTTYFGLRELPFSLSNDLHFFYPTSSTHDIEKKLVTALQELQGLVLLTGDPGTGKTTLLRRITSTADNSIRIISPPFSTLSFDEILTYVSDHLQIHIANSDSFTKVLAIQEHLRTWVQQGWTPVLCIDEAQNLSKETLDRLRLFLHLKSPHGRLLQILLIGQPQLETKLAQPDLRHIQQYIAVHCRLERLPYEDVKHFIQHRLCIAGCERADLFTAEAVAKITHYSQAVPQLINVLCDNALIAAYMAGQHTINDTIVDEVAENLQLQDLSPAATKQEQREAPRDYPTPAIPVRAKKSRWMHNLIWTGVGFSLAWLSSVQPDSSILVTQFLSPNSVVTSLAKSVTASPSPTLPSSLQLSVQSSSPPFRSPTPASSSGPLDAVVFTQQLEPVEPDSRSSEPQTAAQLAETQHQTENPLKATVKKDTRRVSTQSGLALSPEIERSLPVVTFSRQRLAQGERDQAREYRPSRSADKQENRRETSTPRGRIQAKSAKLSAQHIRQAYPFRQARARAALAQRRIPVTPASLMAAAAAGDTQLVDLLLAANVSPNARDRHGWTPLMHAAAGGHRLTVEALLRKGADARVKDRIGQTASMYAARKGDLSFHNPRFHDPSQSPQERLGLLENDMQKLAKRSDYREIALLLKQAETRSLR